MSATGAGYDYSVSTYSPNGRVFQVEYAAKAVEKSGTAIGIRCKDGVVLGVEKQLPSKMLISASNRRIFTCDHHIGLALSGMAADARQLVNQARKESAEYRSFYGAEVPAKILVDRLAMHVHTYTLYVYLRPYGCSVLLAIYDELSGPCLYAVEPSGVAYKYYGCALGRNKQGASAELEKLKFSELTCKEAIKHVARILYKLHDDAKDKDMEIELSWISDDTKRKHVLAPKEVHEEAVREALEAKRKEEMESDDEDEAKDKEAAK